MTADWQETTLGKYRLIRQMAEGSMGEVWLAEDDQLRRQVAIKILPPVLASDQIYLRLFSKEAQATASLEHPHILPVHDFGTQQGQYGQIITYLVMPYISGGTLRDRIRTAKGPISLEETITYLIQAAEAIDYAHSKQIIHRDIKPANMLLQQAWLWLADFGIAKLLTNNTRTQTTAGAGTPEYIAPEQAQGKAELASDRYSLAIITFFMLTGQLPFKGETPYDTLLMQMQATPPSVRQFNPQLSEGVARVLFKGMAKQPDQRYSSCGEFVRALEQAWHAEKAIDVTAEATQPTSWSRHQQPLSPQPSQQQRDSGQQSHPRITSEEALKAHQQGNVPYGPPAYRPPFTASNAAPQQPYQHSNPTLPPTNLQNTSSPAYTHYNGTNQTPQPGLQSKRRRKLIVGGIAAAAVIVAGGGLTAAYLNTQGKKPQTNLVVSPTPAPGPKNLIPGIAMLNITGHSDIVKNVTWDPTGRYLATSGDDTRVMLWDVGSTLQKNSSTLQTFSQPMRQWKFASKVDYDNLCWSADGKYLIVSTGEENKLYVIDAFTPNSQPRVYTDTSISSTDFATPIYDHIAARPHSNAFSVTSTSILSPDRSFVVDLWEINKPNGPSNKFKYPNTDAKIMLDSLNWAMDGTMLAVLLNTNEVQIYNSATGQKITVLNPPARTKDNRTVFVNRDPVIWSRNDTHTLLSFNYDAITIWDIRKTQPLYQLGTDDKTVFTPPTDKQQASLWVPQTIGLDWAPNGRYVVGSYGRSTKIYLWDLQDPNPHIGKDGLHLQKYIFPQIGGHNDTVTAVSWSPSGSYIASGSYDTTVIVWKVDSNT